MDGSARRCDQLHIKSERLTRFSPKHDADRCAPASRIHQLLALLSYSGTKNPARMQILAIDSLGSCALSVSTSSNRGFTSSSCWSIEYLVFPSLDIKWQAYNYKETLMSLDKIIVIAMAVAFFGGIILLGIKSRRNASNESVNHPLLLTRTVRKTLCQMKPREKERRKSNR